MSRLGSESLCCYWCIRHLAAPKHQVAVGNPPRSHWPGAKRDSPKKILPAGEKLGHVLEGEAG